MKTLIIGHGRHGKDTVAQILSALLGCTFASSSYFVMMKAVWPVAKDWGLYMTPEECFEDRSNQRAEWKRLISEYNTPDKSRLCRELLAEYDIYVGMRCGEEYAAVKHLFDKVLWVSRPGYKSEASMTIEYDPTTMIPIVNVGSLNILESQIRKAFGVKA